MHSNGSILHVGDNCKYYYMLMNLMKAHLAAPQEIEICDIFCHQYYQFNTRIISHNVKYLAQLN